MIPEPLHPAVVHFPIVLVVILPIAAVVALLVIRNGVGAGRAWSVPLALAAALSASAFIAVRTGEAEEERVEEVVPEAALHAHEEAAERFLALSLVLAGVAAVGLVGGSIGRSARLVATVGAFGLVFAGLQVGGSGGDLVYEHGAASAYGPATVVANPLGPADPDRR